MVVVFMSEIVIVLLSYVYQLQVGLDLKRNLNSVFQTYYSVEPQETKAIDELQTTVIKEVKGCVNFNFIYTSLNSNL